MKFPTFDLDDLYYITCTRIHGFKTVQRRFEVSSGISSEGDNFQVVARGLSSECKREAIHLSLVIDPVSSNTVKDRNAVEG